MTVKELIKCLLNMPMGADVTLGYEAGKDVDFVEYHEKTNSVEIVGQD